MIKLCKGDLLKSNCDIICHQVNLLGIFGGGVAKQIADLYPECEQKCREFVEWVNKLEKDLLGLYHLYQYKNAILGSNGIKLIANCFSQNERFETDYRALKNIVTMIKDFAGIVGLKTIGIPKNYGCGIAKGDWNKVYRIWANKFKDSTIELQIWEL